MTMETYPCPACGEDYEHDTDTGEGGHWSPLYEDEVCDGCGEDPYPSGLHRFDEEGHTWFSFNDVDADWEDSDGCFPDWASALMKDGVLGQGNWKGRPYKHTDGWRGYYDSEQLFDFEAKATKIEEGWVTGDYSDVSWKRDSHTFFEMLSDEEPPAPIFMLFEPTSNVFSTSCVIFVRKGDEEIIAEWLEEVFPDATSRLHRALG